MVDFKKPLFKPNSKKDDKLTMYNLINNPTGSNSAHVASRKLIKDSLNMKLGLLLNEKRFYLNVYYDEKRDLYIYHVQVPSERKLGKYSLYYDVVFEVKPDEKGDIMYGDMKVFSNSPSFVFTYSNVLYNKGLIPKWLVVKMSKESKKKEPVIKNPDNSLGFEKSIYFAISYIKSQSFNKVGKISQYVKKFDKKILFTIKSFNDKLKESQELTKKLSDEKKKANKKNKKKTVKKRRK